MILLVERDLRQRASFLLLLYIIQQISTDYCRVEQFSFYGDRAFFNVFSGSLGYSTSGCLIGIGYPFTVTLIQPAPISSIQTNFNHKNTLKQRSRIGKDYNSFRNRRKMIKENSIYYQEKTHHRQNLRAGISEQVYNDLEVNENPSQVSRKVYQSLYRQSLQKQIPRQTKLNYSPDRAPYKGQKSQSIFANVGAQVYRNSEYPDYHQEKYKKIEDHIYKNDNGGQDFFRASQQYERNIREKHHRAMQETLAKQMKQKEMNMYNQRNRREHEIQQFNQTLQEYKNNSQLQRRENLKIRNNTRQEQIKQIQAEKTKKNRHSIFQINNKNRHNPITNPIEYHIDNPYILKEIQNKNMSIRASLY